MMVGRAGGGRNHRHTRRQDDRGSKPHQAVRQPDRRRRSQLRRQTGVGNGFPWAERRRKDHHDAGHPGPRPPDCGARFPSTAAAIATSPRRCARSGALLDAKSIHGGRTAQNHLLCLAQSNGIRARRVDEVLGIVGLESVARRRTAGFSLGMGQRLGIAAALLGDPGVLMFDEPVNGLDPEGHRLGSEPDARPGRRGAHGPRVQPSHERDGAHG